MINLTTLYIHLQSKMKDEEGATMVEYALMLAFISAVCFAALTLFGTSIGTAFTNFANLQPKG